LLRLACQKGVSWKYSNQPFRDQLPESVFNEAFSLPVMDGSGNVRRELRQAIALFKEAGYAVQDGVMTNVDSGEVFTNEQYDYWHSRVADEPGSGNVAGIKDEVVDAIIPLIVNASSREEQVAATRALDRVLMHQHYVLPQYFGPTYRVAFTNKFSRPAIKPQKALGFNTWWVDPVKEAALDN